ncbi:Hemolysin-type calcium-binding region, partial [Crocosphaera watsonii WH 0003]
MGNVNQLRILSSVNPDWQGAREAAQVGIDNFNVTAGDDPLPSVSFSITPDTVIENEPGAAFTGTFTVDGNIPTVTFDADGNYVSGGLSVFLDAKEIFELARQFDLFIETDLTIGSSEPAASQPNLFEFILFEETSDITITIFDDIVEEEPFTYNFELLEDQVGSDYIVNPDANTGSFVLEDGLPGGPGVGPDVGVSVTESELFEGEEFTVNFTVTGEAADIPSEENPLTVLVTSDTPASLGEFALFDENGTPLFSTEGIVGVPTPGDLLGSAFFVDLIAPTASLTLEVFEDGPGEGLETINFALANGEVYEVDPDNAGVTLTI